MNYSFHIEHLYVIRKKLMDYLDNTPLEKLLAIPAGCNNNMLWQIGHCVVSQQRLMYTLSDLQMNVSEGYFRNFKIGSSPKEWTSTPNIEEVRASLISTVDQLKADLENGLFKEYKVYKTSSGIVLNNVGEAFIYSNYHEGMHVGNLEIFKRIL
ncbi:MAG: DinB family protein [Bacteroidetes bacterium]|nr:DinB family protein [Bacteroidota bacterium]